MLGRFTVFTLWSLHFLPLPLLAPIGKAVGMLAYAFISERRRVARTNLKLCFPGLSSRQRERLLRQHFRCFGRAILEAGIAWWGSPKRLRHSVRIEGQEHVDALHGEAFICLVPHFVGLELEGARVTMDYRGVAVYVRVPTARVVSEAAECADLESRGLRDRDRRWPVRRAVHCDGA